MAMGLLLPTMKDEWIAHLARVGWDYENVLVAWGLSEHHDPHIASPACHCLDCELVRERDDA